MIHGFDHFTRYFAAQQNDFVIIGGIASRLILETAGLEGRPTRDIDLVILANPSKEFVATMRKYVEEGQYATLQKGDEGESCTFYRFEEPGNKDFPAKIELFAKRAIDFQLKPAQRIIPVAAPDNLDDLSAIMLDDDYFDLLKSNMKSLRGIQVATEVALIPLKAKAYLDLTERKEKGIQINSRDIEKHRKDVFRLSLLLRGADSYPLADSIGQDLLRFLEIARSFKDADFKHSIGKNFNSIAESTTAIRNFFKLS